MTDSLNATAERVVAEIARHQQLSAGEPFEVGMVRSIVEAALKAEREECAKVAQKWPTYSYCNERIAAAIRGRP